MFVYLIVNKVNGKSSETLKRKGIMPSAEARQKAIQKSLMKRGA